MPYSSGPQDYMGMLLLPRTIPGSHGRVRVLLEVFVTWAGHPAPTRYTKYVSLNPPVGQFAFMPVPEPGAGGMYRPHALPKTGGGNGARGWPPLAPLIWIWLGLGAAILVLRHSVSRENAQAVRR